MATLFSPELTVYQPLAHVWAYFLLALMVLTEGPVATLAGAVAASTGYLHPVPVFISAAAGNLTGDTLWYSLGFLGKMELLERVGAIFGVKREQVQRLEGQIEKNAPRLLFIAKLTLGFSIPVLIATGLAKVPIRRWMPFLLIAETIWTGFLVVIGFYFGKYLQTLEQGLHIITIIGGIFFAGFIAFYILKIRKTK